MSSRELPANWIMTAATLQSIGLYLVYRALEDTSWLAETPVVSVPLVAVISSVPVLFMLLAENGLIKALLQRLAVIGGVIALLGAYLGSQAVPINEIRFQGLVASGAVILVLGLFHLSAYLKPNMQGLPYRYPTLFRQSWRSFLIPALAAAMTGLLALVMFLTAQLFKVIGIDMIEWLLRHAWFNFPLFGITFGLGLLTFRRLDTIIASITELLKGLLTLLLPLVVMVTVVFIASLPFTGLSAVWRTGSGTGLVLWLLAGVLFMTNAVYQDDVQASPYPVSLDAALRFGMLALPVLASIAMVGIYQRVAQYGLTVQRCWAIVATLMLTGFAVGYAAQVLFKGHRWRHGLAQVNTVMGICLIAILMLAASPALDFRKLSTSSQLARLDSGAVAIDDFDFRYLRQLARPGHLAIKSLREEYAGDQSVIALMDQQLASYELLAGVPPQSIWDNVVYRPAELGVPDEVRELISQMPFYPGGKAYLIQVDLNGDGDDYALLHPLPGRPGFSGTLFTLVENRWQRFSLQAINDGVLDASEVSALLENGEVKVVPAEFQALSVGGIRLQVQRYNGNFGFIGQANRILVNPDATPLIQRGEGSMSAVPMTPVPVAPSPE
jgi:hypothetical protein